MSRDDQPASPWQPTATERATGKWGIAACRETLARAHRPTPVTTFEPVQYPPIVEYVDEVEESAGNA